MEPIFAVNLDPVMLLKFQPASIDVCRGGKNSNLATATQIERHTVIRNVQENAG
uniref:Uncharacterized protein n=1 Tax=Daphnia galeata TaxID=27404 RepID=A0A8J2WLK8_9CRUS|nr:unnamed protein product [Daphnia galeata]